MKIKYDASVDVLVITLRDGDISESDEVSPGVIVDFALDGTPLAIEILQAQQMLAPDGVLTMEMPIHVIVK